MKTKNSKKTSFFIIIAIFFAFLPIVYALEYKESFKKYYDTTSGFSLNTKEITDGFISTFVDMSSTNTSIYRIDENGNVIWSKEIGSLKELDVIGTTNGNFIYAGGDSSYTVVLLDNNGNEIKTILNSPTNVYTDANNYTTTSWSSNGRNLFELSDSSLFVINSTTTEKTSNTSTKTKETLLYKIDSNGNILDSISINNYTTYGIYENTDNIYLFSYNEEENTYYLIDVTKDLTYTTNKLDLSTLTDEMTNDLDNGKFTSLTQYNNDLYYATSTGIYKIEKTTSIVSLMIGSSTESNAIDYTSLIYKNNYFIAGGVTTDENGYTIAVAVIYDDKFNEIETLNLNEIFSVAASDGFYESNGTYNIGLSITKGLTVTTKGFLINGMLLNKPYIIEYQFPFNIYTKTDGNGVITPSTTKEYSNNEVTFTIIPNEGYTLDKIKITDANNNSITYTDNSFIMPSADVTIEVSFAIQNPDTQAFLPKIAIISFILLIILNIFITLRKIVIKNK